MVHISQNPLKFYKLPKFKDFVKKNFIQISGISQKFFKNLNILFIVGLEIFY